MSDINTLIVVVREMLDRIDHHARQYERVRAESANAHLENVSLSLRVSNAEKKLHDTELRLNRALDENIELKDQLIIERDLRQQEQQRAEVLLAATEKLTAELKLARGREEALKRELKLYGCSFEGGE